jgi:hypothetical protein
VPTSSLCSLDILIGYSFGQRRCVVQEVLMSVFFGLIHAVALIFVMHHIDMKKFAGYDVWFDILCTIFFTVLYNGTYHGTTIGIFAGLFMTLYLRWYRLMFGYKKYEKDGMFGYAWFYYHNNPKGRADLARVKVPKGAI